MKKLKHYTKFTIQMAAVIILAVIDRVIKLEVIKDLKPIGSVTLINKVFALTYAENTGAAFSIFSGSTVALSVFTLIVIICGIVYLVISKNHPKIYDILLPLILAGGIGNLYERFAYGYVVDYLQVLFIDFPVFNFADCLITCSAIVLMVYLIYDIIKDGKKQKERKAHTGGSENNE